MCKAHSKVTHIKQQKYFHHLKGCGYNKNSVLYPGRFRWWKYFCCFICVTLLWALHVVVIKHFFTFITSRCWKNIVTRFISIVMSNVCPFCIMAAILDFRALKCEKSWHPIFFLCLYYILTESGEFLLLPKNARNFISWQMSLHYYLTCWISSGLSSVLRFFGMYPAMGVALYRRGAMDNLAR